MNRFAKWAHERAKQLPERLAFLLVAPTRTMCCPNKKPIEVKIGDTLQVIGRGWVCRIVELIFFKEGHMKKLIVFSFLFCWCSNSYGQKSVTDSTNYLDVTQSISITTGILYSDQIWIDLIELYEIYETECFNDSTLIISGGGPKVYTPKPTLDSLGRKVLDMTEIISVPAVYIIRKKWVHLQPSFIGFMQYLKEQNK